MILIIPSIDLQSGNCKDCICSVLPMVDHYRNLQENPEELSRLFRKENAKTLHINDLDSLYGTNNENNIETIKKIRSAVEIPIQVYSRYESYDECASMLDIGIHRIVLDHLFQKKPNAVRELIDEYTSSRISFFADIDILGKPELCVNHELVVDDCIKSLREAGGDRIILKDNSNKKDIPVIVKYANYLTSRHGLKITLNDLAENYNDLDYINKNSNYFIDSIILGRSLYNNKFPCQQIWRMAESRFDFNPKRD